eukprot:gene8891-11991_t
MSEAMCTCASEMVRCPHGTSARLPQYWDEMEQIIDDVLQRFDRSTIRKFLKRGSDGNQKSDNLKDAYKSEGIDSFLDKITNSGTSKDRAITAPLGKRAKDGSYEMSKTLPVGGMKPSFSPESSTLPSNSRSKVGELPTYFGNKTNPGTLPKLPPRVSQQSSSTTDLRGNHVALISISSVSKQTRVNAPADKSKSQAESMNRLIVSNRDKGVEFRSPIPLEIPTDTNISIGLMQIADSLSRKVLPWQAVLCPRAVETLHDLRLVLIQNKHTAFISQMKQKLEDKVMSFIQKKEQEIDFWIEKELTNWQAAMAADESGLLEFLQNDQDRMQRRATYQEQAYRQRELVMAANIDDHERDTTREQLINFRRICRSDVNGPEQTNDSPSYELKTLQDSIVRATEVANKQIIKNARDIARNIEEAHDWLCSLADNAITAAASEDILKELYSGLDKQKSGGVESLHSAFATYKDQHNAIIEAIIVFAGRIHQHATDYLQREQLISRAFLQYLLNIMNGEIKTYANDHKKNSFAWESKSLLDRMDRKDMNLIQQFNDQIGPMDKLVNEFKDRMKVQLERITVRLQSVVNGRENDVNSRKAAIHRKLAKHVNKSCNARRLRLKEQTAVRREEFQIEAKCIGAVDELCHDLRNAIDHIWVKEHLKERRMYEASTGRMDRLEKSALIIWNKHSHLAIGQKEEYEDWLAMYYKDRDVKIAERKAHCEREWRVWRLNFGKEIKSFALSIKQPSYALLKEGVYFNMEETVEQNIESLTFNADKLLNEVYDNIEVLRGKVETFLVDSTRGTDEFAIASKHALLLEWRDNLYRLNSAINRRVGGLKDMESDLEESIRLTMLQHEVEIAVFEQLSCSRLEHFWIEWRNKMFATAGLLRDEQEEYHYTRLAKKIAKQGAAGLGDTASTGNNTELPQINNNTTIKTNTQQSLFADKNSKKKKTKVVDRSRSDTTRILRLLDEIRPEIFRDFSHKMTRGLEKVRRDLGEGRRLLVPAYAVVKVLLSNADRFWEKAKLAERCVGRITSRGQVIFSSSDGLPVHARSMFCVTTAMFVVSSIANDGAAHGYRIDAEDVLALLETSIKKCFLIALLSLTMKQGEFGDYFLRSECLWSCAAFGIEPPNELVATSQSVGLQSLKQSYAEKHPTGFHSDDPVDLMNSVLRLVTDIEEIEKNEQIAREAAEAAAIKAKADFVRERLNQSQSVNELDDVDLDHLDLEDLAKTPDVPPIEKESTDLRELFQTISVHVPLERQMAKLSFILPTTDAFVLACFLGRPNGEMEFTAHRVCQTISCWRKVALTIIAAAMDPPEAEYPKTEDLISAHAATASIISTSRANQRPAYETISCISPFEAVSSVIDWITSIKGLPLSVLQSLALITRGGSCDPWLEDPKSSQRAKRFAYEVNELLESYTCSIPKSMKHNEFMQATFASDLIQALHPLDVNDTKVMPLEMLRSFMQREDPAVSNAQLTAMYWSLCRVNDDPEELLLIQDTSDSKGDGITINNSQSSPHKENTMEESDDALHKASTVTKTTGGGNVRPIVATEFHADPSEYLSRFEHDVDKYLESMPSIDVNAVLGQLHSPLITASAHELVSDAMKLDVSARNPMPSTCCVWLAERQTPLEQALSAVTVPERQNMSRGGNCLIGVGETSLRSPSTKLFTDFRSHVELDLIIKFPELCESRAADKNYGPVGSEPMVAIASKPGVAQSNSVFNPTDATTAGDEHWLELTNRRLSRMDKLTLSWRDTMLNEWATSLYQSRQKRYYKRVDIVRQCVGVYHKQYATLRESILAERTALISRYASIESELLSLIQDDYNYFTFNASYVERSLKRFEGHMERALTLLKNMLIQYERHCGTIKRRGIARVIAASERLRLDLEESCRSMILGYTTGYAQAYFDELIYRGEVWRQELTKLQGEVIVEKEKFMIAKDEIDRDLTIQITDRLTIDRNRTKGHLEFLSEESSKLLDVLANTRSSYASIQKDANARLILRIEKAIRESRKLRVAAEQQPELEGPAMRDIRLVLDTAKRSCLSIVEQIKETSLKQLRTFEPLRKPHRERMIAKTDTVRIGWVECENMLAPLVVDYEKQVLQQLKLMQSKAIEMIGVYNEREMKSLKKKYASERSGLIYAFRKHFTEYDLAEAMIFDSYNREIIDTVNEMNRMWGPSRPKFIVNGLFEIDCLAKESLDLSNSDIVSNMHSHKSVNDELLLTRMEIADVFQYSLNNVSQVAGHLPHQFITEKKKQIREIDDLSMAKNGDMIRPQVKAVIDMLISGIEIDVDFGKGYESLFKATDVKTSEAYRDLDNFADRYEDPEKPLSIGYSASLTRGRIQRRGDEVNSLLEASQAHMVADHSRLDVLVNAGEKDIEEWASLTIQLVESSFHNAELTYLSNLWPTPPATPRIEPPLEEEDRVGKLKALLVATQEKEALLALANSDNYNNSNANGLVPYDPRMISNAVSSTGDHRSNGIDDDDEELLEQERLKKKELKRIEKENRRKQREDEAKRKEDEELQQQLIANAHSGLTVDEMREVQQGWYECASHDGYKYYFNPTTGESLWDLPAALKVPLYSDIEEAARKLIDTPRALIMNDPKHLAAPKTPTRIVSADHNLDVVIDPKVVMSSVTEEARAVAAITTETALDITLLIHGRKGVKDEKSIIKLLGNKINPALLKKLLDEEDVSNYVPDNKSEDDRGSHLQSNRKVFSDDGLEMVFAEATGDAAFDPQLQAALLELGLSGDDGDYDKKGKKKSKKADPINEDEEDEHSHNTKSQKLLDFGFAAKSADINDESSDDEHLSATKSRESRRHAKEERFKESIERDVMTQAEQESIVYENYIENINCNRLQSSLKQLLDTNSATYADKSALEAIAKVIRPINLIDIMTGLKASWERVDLIIKETLDRERERELLQERVRTEEGLLRQQTIIDHGEDIEEMSQFMHDKVGLSKIISRKAATESILRKISTPKKLAKIWNRGEIRLQDLGIDKDDIEELEDALKKLLLESSTNNLSSASFAGVMSPIRSMDSFYLDPGLVTEVKEYDDGEAEEDYAHHDSFNGSMHSFSKSPQPSPAKFKLTKDGYKSFRGGWIEGLSEHGETYYYNTMTGESSWHLPGEAYDESSEHHIDALPATNPNLHYPTNNFAHAYADYNINQNQQYDQQGYEEYDQNQHYYDNNQQVSEYDPNQNYHEQHYDPNPPDHNNYHYDNTHEYDPNQNYHNYEEYPHDYSQYPADYPQDYHQEWDPNAYHEPAHNNNDPNYYPEGVHSDGTWNLKDALGESHSTNPNDVVFLKKARTLPIPVKLEVHNYSKQEGVTRQLVLLSAQDKWQNALVKCQHFITEQKSQYLKKREEMFEKVSLRVETRLGTYVDDIKFMQRSIKKDLGESNSTERDIRRIFEQEHGNAINAEKLSFILESLETLKEVSGHRYESAQKQLEKFASDWQMIKTELNQVGDIFDEGLSANLEQCRLACEHTAKVFAYDQLKYANEIKKVEMVKLRKALRPVLKNDTLEEQEARARLREEHVALYRAREIKKQQLRKELDGWPAIIEAELVEQGFPKIEPEREMAPEEEMVMSYLLTQIEMEMSLGADYESIVEATKTMAIELQSEIKTFDDKEKGNIHEDGSWFNKHRETITRHEAALNTTLMKVRTRVNDGYKLLNSKLEALDFDVERAAEEELFQSTQNDD